MTLRHDWRLDEVNALFALPFNDLLFQAHSIHRAHFPANEVQIATLLSIKTGACPEDCGYCSQSGHHNTNLEKEKLMDVAAIVEKAKIAKDNGASRFCMGAAWRSMPKKAMPALEQVIKEVKALGLETCMTLGMLDGEQADALAKAGLDYYNHNLDTSPEYYKKVVTTRTYEDRLQTLSHVRESGMNVCCGGIIGMGEDAQDRSELLIQLANLPAHPKSVPINMLVAVPGTPLQDAPPIDGISFVRTIAVARIMMPESFVRLSAGREAMSDELQALCFFAGANSLFYGDKLLTTSNPSTTDDQDLMQRLGLMPYEVSATQSEPSAIAS